MTSLWPWIAIAGLGAFHGLSPANGWMFAAACGVHAREITASGSLAMALAAVSVHTAAMLVTTGIIATAVCRGVAMHSRLLSGGALHRVWTAALAATGVLLITFR